MSGPDRNELGAFLVHAAISSARDQAFACLLGLNGQDHPTRPAMGGWGCDYRPYGGGLVVMYLWKTEWSV